MTQEQFVEYTNNELTHSPPTSAEHAQVHAKVSDLFVEFGEKLAEIVLPSPDGTNFGYTFPFEGN